MKKMMMMIRGGHIGRLMMMVREESRRRRRIYIGSGGVVSQIGGGGGRLLQLGWLFWKVKFLSFDLSVFIEVEFEGVDVVLESEGGDGPEDIVAVNRLPLLALALVGGFSGDEADEFRHAFLDGLLGFLGDLAVAGDHLFHDPSHVGYRQESVLFFVVCGVCGFGAFGACSDDGQVGEVSGLPFVVFRRGCRHHRMGVCVGKIRRCEKMVGAFKWGKLQMAREA